MACNLRSPKHQSSSTFESFKILPESTQHRYLGAIDQPPLVTARKSSPLSWQTTVVNYNRDGTK